MQPQPTHIAYSALIVLNMMLGALATQLGTGKVPIPADWVWLVPVAIAGLTAATMLLPKLSDLKN